MANESNEYIMSDVPNEANVHEESTVDDGPNQNKKRNRNGKSTITKANAATPSVRTTIPREVIEMLGWDAGDVLSWEIEKRGEKYFVIIRRLE